MTISPQTLDIIRQQLGREPRGMMAVAAESADGVPLVLQMRSVVDGKPFPTLYWLCSSTLHKAIARLETAGVVKALEQWLQQDAAFQEAYRLNQQDYVERRLQLMLEEDAAYLRQRGLWESFNRQGIGGIARWDRVRCLHMQYAHHLVEGNVIGAWLDQHYQLNQQNIYG